MNGEKEEEEDDDDLNDDSTSNKRRRSKRTKKEKEKETEKEDESALYSESERRSNLDAAWEQVAGTHSAEDFTPWITLFYFGFLDMVKNGHQEKDALVVEQVANLFHVKQDQVLGHLSEFVETQNAKKPPKKKRRTK